MAGGGRKKQQKQRAEEPRRGDSAALLSDAALSDLARLAESVDDPAAFLTGDAVRASSLRSATKTLYDHAKKDEPCKTLALPQLLVDGFEDEQVWQQIALLNKPVLKFLEGQVDRMTKTLSSVAEPEGVALSDEDGEAEEGDDAEEGEEEEAEEAEEEEEEEEEEAEEAEDDAGEEGEDVEIDAMDAEEEEEEGVEGADGSDDEGVDLEDLEGAEGLDAEMEDGEGEVDDDKEPKEGAGEGVKEDRFFSLEDMEKFVDEADEFEAEEGIEDPDMASDDDEEGEGEGQDGAKDEANKDGPGRRRGHSEADAKFDDFFDPPTKDEEDADEPKSKHEKNLAQIRKKISALEDESVAQRHWTMKGEVSRRDRPENSLLEAVVEFDTAAKPPPVVTQETTMALNDIIMKRVKDASWDDVERKTEVEVAKPTGRKVNLEATREQRGGLAEEYEKEYRNKIAPTAAEKTEGDQLTEEQREVEHEFRRLCTKLDALAHFHYTPKQVEAKIGVLTKNTPAISMEEAIPVAASTASLLAPEEVFEQKPEAPESKDELSREERRKQHRAAKRTARRARGEREAEQKKQDEKEPESSAARRRSTAKSLEELKGSASVRVVASEDKFKGGKKQNYRSSSFFTRLQEESRTDIKKGARSAKSPAPAARSARAIKL